MPGQFVTNQNRAFLLAPAVTNRLDRKFFGHKAACRCLIEGGSLTSQMSNRRELF